MTSSALQVSSSLGPVVSSTGASVQAAISTISVRLGRGNFMLWKGIAVPILAGANLHGHLDGTTPAPVKTLTQGTGDAAVTTDNPEYLRWWTQDQKVVGLLLSSMDEDIACQLVGCKTAQAVWTSVTTMFSAQSRANVRHIKRQLHSLRKEELSAAEYMHKMKALADVMAAAGSPIDDDDLIDYILIGLGSGYNSIAASLSVSSTDMSYSSFYSLVMSFEALQAQQSLAEGWSSSANAATRPGSFGNGGRAPQQELYSAPYGGGRPAGGNGQPGQGRQGGNSGAQGSYDRNTGYANNGRQGGSGGNTGGNGWRRQQQVAPQVPNL